MRYYKNMITFEILVDDLKKNSSGQKYIDFNKKIVNSKLQLIGVKLPVLRKFIKKYKDIDLNTFVPNQYFETNFIYIGIILEKIGSLNEAFKFLFNNKELIDSWAMTDSTYQYIKISSNLDEDINIIDKFLTTDNEFMIRYGYLLFFNYYKQEKNYENIISRIRSSEYFYVYMVEAWLLSYLMIEFYDDTYNFIKDSKIDLKLKLKAISKCIDSYRLSKSQKDKLKDLRVFLKSN